MSLTTKSIVLIVAMVLIATMSCVAMLCGLNGWTLTGAIGAIVTIAGYLFRQKEDKTTGSQTEE